MRGQCLREPRHRSKKLPGASRDWLGGVRAGRGRGQAWEATRTETGSQEPVWEAREFSHLDS